MNSALKRNARRVSAVLAGFAMAATITGLTVTGTASAAPAPAQTETTATASGDYAAARGTYYMTFRTSTRCQEVADWLWTFDGITDTWCLQGNAMGTVWHVYYEGRL
ncbi:hypothetical protein GCM10009830_29620 [Glycomyces endophyticus]|uniref:Uncharacterized protein n=2 Tax=Glycomyces endophyticus TaxID=480996 RepID=A0ABN2H211_9ACTN